MKRTTLLASTLAVITAGILLTGCADQNIPLTIETAPPAVAAAFRKSYPDAKIIDVRKKVYERKGVTKYNIEFQDGAGNNHDVNFDEQGKPVR